MTLYVTNAALVEALTQAALLGLDNSLWSSTTLHLNVGALGDVPWSEAIKGLGGPNGPHDREAQMQYLKSFVETSNWPLNEANDVMSFFDGLVRAITTGRANKATRLAKMLVSSKIADMLPTRNDDVADVADAVDAVDDDSGAQVGIQGGAKFNRSFEFDKKLQRLALSM